MIELDKGQTITVFVEPLMQQAELQLSLNVSRGGTTLAPSVAAAPGELAYLQTVRVGNGGIFMITVGAVGAETGPYRLRVVLNAAIETEPITGMLNDGLASAQSIDNAFVNVIGNAQRAADTYSFTLRAGQRSTIALSGFLGQVDLLDGAGNVLALGTSSSNLDSVVQNFVAPATGTYYVRVTRGLVGDYQLVVTRNLYFDIEPNQLDSPQQIETGATERRLRVLGHIDPYDTDVYQVDLPS